MYVAMGEKKQAIELHEQQQQQHSICSRVEMEGFFFSLVRKKRCSQRVNRRIELQKNRRTIDANRCLFLLSIAFNQHI
jgi:hypothetical protein